MLTDAEVAKMPDEEKSALLHSLMKHHTAPTEGLVASLTSRLEGLQDLIGKPKPEDMVAQRISESLQHDQTVYMLAVQAMTATSRDMTAMYQHAARTIGYAQEVIAAMAATRLGVPISVPPAYDLPSTPPVACAPGTPARPPQCPPAPADDEPAAVYDGEPGEQDGRPVDPRDKRRVPGPGR